MSDKTPIAITPVTRKSFSLEFKRYAVRYIDLALATKRASVTVASEELCVPHFYYARWKRMLEKVDDMKKTSEFIAFKTNAGSRKIHPGRPSGLEDIRDGLSRSIFELREQGIQVNTRTVRNEASRMSETFNQKSMKAKKASVARFVKKMGYTHRIGTHVAQKNYKDTEEDALQFIVMMREKVALMDPDDVLNMDQTPIPYSYHTSRTLELKGKRTIHVRSSTSDTKRATLAAAVSGSGKLLKPFLIFKGKSDGRIAQKELQTFPGDCFYACQPKAWMDANMMNLWIDLVLIPWKESRKPGVVPLLILDAYRVHMMGSIVNRIQSLGVEVQHIPGGCTWLCQPVDVGINRPIKKEMTEQWEKWMFNGGGVVDGVVKEPTRNLVAEWIIGAYKNISEEIGQNAWKKTGYEWFIN
jgi:hypothetical protein